MNTTNKDVKYSKTILVLLSQQIMQSDWLTCLEPISSWIADGKRRVLPTINC